MCIPTKNSDCCRFRTVETLGYCKFQTPATKFQSTSVMAKSLDCYKIKVEPTVSSLLQDCPKGVFNNSLIYSETVTKHLQNIAHFQVKTVTISIFHYVTWKTTKSDLANFTDFGSFGAITVTAATSSSWKLLQIKTDCVLVRHHSMHHHKASYPHTSLNKYHFYCCLLHCTNIF